MDWLDNMSPRARLALSVGGAWVAALAGLLPLAWHVVAFAAGIALCCYGVAASMGPLLQGKDPGWLEEERKKDFERQQNLHSRKFRHVK